MALVAILAGCGDDGGNAPGDATSIDAAPPDGLARSVAVAVYDFDGVPTPGVDVVLHDSDGAVLATQQTDAAGHCAFVGPPAGAMVTILRRNPTTNGYEASTVVAVEPGDTIRLGEPLPALDPTFDVTVTFPGPVTGAKTYEAASCGAVVTTDATLPASGSVGTSCLAGDNDFAVLAAAYAGSDALAFSVVRDIMPASQGPTAIQIPAWSAPELFDLRIANAPGGAEISQLVANELDGRVLGYALQTPDGHVVPNGALVDRRFTQTMVGSGLSGPDFRSWVHRRMLPADTASPHTLDFSELGPTVESISFDTTNPGRPSASWTISGSTATSSGVAFRIVWWADASNPAPPARRWLIVIPPERTMITVPALPEPLAAYSPSSSADYWYQQVFTMWSEKYPTFTALRNAQPFDDGFVDGPFDSTITTLQLLDE